MLERLNLHARNGFHVVLRHLVVETRDLVLHKAGQFHVEGRVALSDAFDDALQIVLIQFREFREAIVGEQVGEFLRLTPIILKIDGDFLRPHEQCGLETAVAAHDQPAAFAHRDRPAPPLVLNDRRKKLDLMRAVPVRIGRIRLERRRIDEGIVGAVDLHDDRCVSKTGQIAPRSYRASHGALDSSNNRNRWMGRRNPFLPVFVGERGFSVRPMAAHPDGRLHDRSRCLLSFESNLHLRARADGAPVFYASPHRVGHAWTRLCDWSAQGVWSVQ